jgi:hypothetical protein
MGRVCPILMRHICSMQYLQVIYYSIDYIYIYISYGFHTWCKFVDAFFYLLVIGFLIIYKECRFKSKIYGFSFYESRFRCKSMIKLSGFFLQSKL